MKKLLLFIIFPVQLFAQNKLQLDLNLMHIISRNQLGVNASYPIKDKIRTNLKFSFLPSTLNLRNYESEEEFLNNGIEGLSSGFSAAPGIRFLVSSSEDSNFGTWFGINLGASMVSFKGEKKIQTYYGEYKQAINVNNVLIPFIDFNLTYNKSLAQNFFFYTEINYLMFIQKEGEAEGVNIATPHLGNSKIFSFDNPSTKSKLQLSIGIGYAF